MTSISRACRIRNPALFICDIQEKFRPVIYEYPKLINTTTKLLKAASSLQTPLYITTQNRARLGDTVSELQQHFASTNVRANVDKTLFSMVTPEVISLLPDTGKGETPLDAIVVGIETHICVTQTTLDLLERGHRV
ncbi:hypothetical protein LTS12_028450, partial [Elasticomyces elasticus]